MTWKLVLLLAEAALLQFAVENGEVQKLLSNELGCLVGAVQHLLIYPRRFLYLGLDVYTERFLANNYTDFTYCIGN